MHYNSRVLRRGLKGEFVTTIHVLNSAIVKLARKQRACVVYRGVKGGVLPEAFWTANEVRDDCQSIIITIITLSP